MKPRCPGSGTRPLAHLSHEDRRNRAVAVCAHCQRQIRLTQTGQLRWHGPAQPQQWISPRSKR